MSTRLPMLLVLVAFAAVSLSTLGTASPRGLDTPDDEFSAYRALAHLEVIATAPRPHGSAANERTADYIVGLANDLGLRADMDRVPGASSIHVAVPGTASTGVVVLTAHLDSATGAPGAGDDGLGVVALLETMRVLASDPPLRNDILFLFTDGEESGRDGAASFAASASAHDVAVVIAMEGEPGGGPTTLQQTSPGSGWLMSQVAAADVPAWASSSWDDPERADDDSDFDVLSTAGLAGVEFANPKDATRYHTARDAIGAVDPSLVQSHGETALRLARHLGALDLAASDRGGDAVYVTLPVVGIVTWSESLADATALMAAVLAIAAMIAAMATGRTTARRLAASAAVAVGVVALLSAAALVGWDAVAGALAPDDIVAFDDFDHSAWVMLAIMAGAAVAALIIAGRWSRRRNHEPADVAVASLALLLIAHIVRFAETPLGSPVTTWPLLAASLSLGAWLWLPRVLTHVVLALAAAPALFLLTPQLILMAESPGDGAAPAVAVTLLLLASLAPQLLVVAGADPRPISFTAPEPRRAHQPPLVDALPTRRHLPPARRHRDPPSCLNRGVSMNSFDARAATWDDDPVKVERADAVARKIQAAVPLNQSLRMLEYGAGTGLVTQALRDSVGPVTLADTSTGMRDVICAKIDAGAITDARVWDLDLATQPAPDEHFDLIVTVLTLHHIENTGAVLARFGELLDEGGTLCVVDLDEEDGSFHGHDFQGHHGFERSALASDLAAAGFADVVFADCHQIVRDGVAYPMFLVTCRRAHSANASSRRHVVAEFEPSQGALSDENVR